MKEGKSQGSERRPPPINPNYTNNKITQQPSAPTEQNFRGII
jgi:hypothetical protein